MAVLSPSPLPGGRSEILFSGFSPPPEFPAGFSGRSPGRASLLEDTDEENGGKVYVAVGKTVAKAAALLKWCLRTFEGSEICILHVHKPSHLIPTLLGKLPASQANAKVVTAFRIEEREETEKLLNTYLRVCTSLKIKASIVTSVSNQVENEIVNLVNTHGIKKLVIGAAPDCSKLKKCSNKASYAAKMAPPFCKIWFVNKGNLVWTKENTETLAFAAPRQQEHVLASSLRSSSVPSGKSALMFHPDFIRSGSVQYPTSSGIKTYSQRELVGQELGSSSHSLSRNNPSTLRSLSPASLCSSSGYVSSAESRLSLGTSTNVEEDGLSEWLEELNKEAKESRDEAVSQLVVRQKMEAEAAKAIHGVKVFESARAQLVKLRKEDEDALRTTIQEKDKLVEDREVLTGELQKAVRTIALLENRTQEANSRCEDVAGELKLIQASLATLRQEKQKIQRQKIEAVQWLDHWKSRKKMSSKRVNAPGQFNEEIREVAEVSLLDLQSATCDFSESFKVGEGGYGCVYKGEILDKTVAIKMLRAHSIRHQPEFSHEAQVLGRLRHPHLTTLIGVCPEAWSLIYEYVPGGTLQDRLFQRSNVNPLDWKTRVRIISEIANGLLCLHSFGPEGITHGDLKPNNILLNAEGSCKICDFGIFRLVPEQSLRYPSFRRYTETRVAFPYADPEFYRTGIMTPKSDIFSFGLIILQLLTGKAPAGLADDVRRIFSYGQISSILDSSAGEWSTYVVRRLMDLGLQCCKLNGRDRPSLTPMLVRELEQLHTLEEKTVPSFFLCPILRELMYDPQVAADGFTYEGDALRGWWFENGRETSPMTNLKLSDFTLTPNHSLRLAIRDWLQKL